MRKSVVGKGIVVGITLLFFGTSISPCLTAGFTDVSETANILTGTNSYHCLLDYYFIRNITKNLSDIIFTYNESNGEIARGREFGSSGEHIAARILWENMSKLGLWTYNQSIGGARPWRPSNLIVSRIEALEYRLTLRNNNNRCSFIVDCSPIIANIGPRLRPWKVTRNISFNNLRLVSDFSSGDEGKVPYMILSGGTKTRDNAIPLEPFPTVSTGRLLQDLGKFFNRTRDYYLHPLWKGSILYDSNKNEHDMWFSQSFVPKFSINGSIGQKVEHQMGNYTVDFYLKQRFNLTVDSHNVIGQLNGSDPTKTVLVCCLYDSWWCQGTGDSAIGMAIVMGVAKYYQDHHITPKYTMKFIAFGGEEYGMRGSKYYQATHRCENIICVIDLNQLGFTQVNPRLTLEIAANNQTFLDSVWKIVERTNYKALTNNTTDIIPRFMKEGHISDDRSFASKRPNVSCKTVCFLKDGPWLMHHRDGLNHTAGDVFSYFNSTDVNATGDMVVNVTQSITNGTILAVSTQNDAGKPTTVLTLWDQFWLLGLRE